MRRPARCFQSPGRRTLTNSISPGGQAALTGFLFQITRTLSQALEHSVAIRTGNISDGDATLILEPPNGGDVRFETAQTAYVEQHKSRSTQNRWNATEIISQVLPDLWAAENDLRHKSGVQYAFVTDGRGPTDPFLYFLKACQTVSQPDDLSDDPDAVVQAFGMRLSHRALFDRIGATLGVKLEERQRLLCVLQNLDIMSDASRNRAEAMIDGFLRGLTEEKSEVASKRHELVGRLFRLSSEGGVISAVTLLEESGLPIERLSVGVAAQARCSEKLTTDLKRIGYDRNADVRKAPPSFPETGVILLKGESGAGKSWLIARWADELRNHGASAVILRNIATADEIAAALNQVIWIPAGFARPADTHAIAARIRDDQPPDVVFWLTIFLDDPEAACLEPLARQELSSMGIRIVIASTRIDEERVRRSFGSVRSIPTPLFTLDESKSLLVTNGPLSEAGWRALPSDMMRLMRRPMTAFLYRETARRQTFEPRTEYDLMEAYWRSLQDRPALHPGDLHYLDGLVLALLDDPRLYPWPFTLVHQRIPEDAVRTRLTTAGVLQDGSNGWVMEHDRVLNWAVAQALFKTEHGGAAPIATVAERFATLRGHNAASGTVSWRLGYLLMDLFAIALKTRPHSDALALLGILSEDRRQHDVDSSFYTSLLPTLGAAALPFYEAVLEERRERERPLPFELAAGLIAISRSEPEAVTQLSGRLLSSEKDDAVSTALQVGVKFPLTEHLALVWRRHAEIAVDRASGARRFHDLDTSGKAFDRAVAARPDFLSTLLESDLSDDELVAALWRLVNVPYHQGEPIWSRYKAMVFARLPQEGRLLAVLADVFDDAPSLDRAAALLDESRDDWAQPYHLGVQARRNPEAAFGLLGRLGLRQVEPASNWWLDDLLDATGDEGQARLIELASQEEDGAWSLNRSFRHAPHLANEATLTFIARDTLSRLQALRADSSLNARPMMDTLSLFADADPNALQNALTNIDADCLFDHLAYFLSGKDKTAWPHFRHDVDNAVPTAFAAGPDIFASFVASLLDGVEPRDSWDLLQAASLVKDDRLGDAVVRMVDRWRKESGPLGIVAIPLVAQERFRELFSLLMNAEQVSWIAEGVILPDHLANCSDQFTEIERQQVLAELDHTTDAERRGRMIGLIDLLKIKEGEGRLRALVSDELMDDSMRIAAAKSLLALDFDQTGLGAFAGSVLKSSEKNKPLFEAAADLCLRLDDQEAEDAVREYFRTKTEGSFSSTESQLLGWLVKDADLNTLEEILEENSTRFVREELESVIRNTKAKQGDGSVAAELEDIALSPARGFFGGDNPAYALRSLAQIKPDTAFDIAANQYYSQPTADNAARMWSLNPERALDLLFDQTEFETKPSIVRMIGRRLNLNSPDRTKLINKVCERCLGNHPETKRLAVAILAWLEGSEIEKTIRNLTKDPDRQTAHDAQQALRDFRRRSSGRRSREALDSCDRPLAYLHLNRVLSEGDWQLAESGEKTALGLPGSPLFGSLHAEGYVRRLLRKAREAERRKRD